MFYSSGRRKLYELFFYSKFIRRNSKNHYKAFESRKCIIRNVYYALPAIFFNLFLLCLIIEQLFKRCNSNKYQNIMVLKKYIIA